MTKTQFLTAAAICALLASPAWASIGPAMPPMPQPPVAPPSIVPPEAPVSAVDDLLNVPPAANPAPAPAALTCDYVRHLYQQSADACRTLRDFQNNGIPVPPVNGVPFNYNRCLADAAAARDRLLRTCVN